MRHLSSIRVESDNAPVLPDMDRPSSAPVLGDRLHSSGWCESSSPKRTKDSKDLKDHRDQSFRSLLSLRSLRSLASEALLEVPHHIQQDVDRSAAGGRGLHRHLTVNVV